MSFKKVASLLLLCLLCTFQGSYGQATSFAAGLEQQQSNALGNEATTVSKRTSNYFRRLQQVERIYKYEIKMTYGFPPETVIDPNTPEVRDLLRLTVIFFRRIIGSKFALNFVAVEAPRELPDMQDIGTSFFQMSFEIQVTVRELDGVTTPSITDVRDQLQNGYDEFDYLWKYVNIVVNPANPVANEFTVANDAAIWVAISPDQITPMPTVSPGTPTVSPSATPSQVPSQSPTIAPTGAATTSAPTTIAPTSTTAAPTSPSEVPSSSPSVFPSQLPSTSPSESPSAMPSEFTMITNTATYVLTFDTEVGSPLNPDVIPAWTNEALTVHLNQGLDGAFQSYRADSVTPTLGQTDFQSTVWTLTYTTIVSEYMGGNPPTQEQVASAITGLSDADLLALTRARGGQFSSCSMVTKDSVSKEDPATGQTDTPGDSNPASDQIDTLPVEVQSATTTFVLNFDPYPRNPTEDDQSNFEASLRAFYGKELANAFAGSYQSGSISVQKTNIMFDGSSWTFVFSVQSEFIEGAGPLHSDFIAALTTQLDFENKFIPVLGYDSLTSLGVSA